MKKYQWGNYGGNSYNAAAAPTRANWVDGQSGDSFHFGEEPRVMAMGSKINGVNAGEENQETS